MQRTLCLRAYISKPSTQRQLWLASGICKAILKTQGLRPKPVYLRSPKEQLMRVRTGAQLPGREADPSNSCSAFPAPPEAGAGREEGSTGCTRNSMEDGGYLSAFYKQTQSTETPSPPLQLPLLMGMCTHSAGCPERPFACVPTVLEPGDASPAQHGLQASVICKLWLMCTSIKNSALQFAKAQARHSIGAGMEGDMLPQCEVY